jgi:hypothetical protein
MCVLQSCHTISLLITLFMPPFMLRLPYCECVCHRSVTARAWVNLTRERMNRRSMIMLLLCCICSLVQLLAVLLVLLVQPSQPVGSLLADYNALAVAALTQPGCCLLPCLSQAAQTWQYASVVLAQPAAQACDRPHRNWMNAFVCTVSLQCSFELHPCISVDALVLCACPLPCRDYWFNLYENVASHTN